MRLVRLADRGAAARFNNARFRVGTLGVNVADLEKRFDAGAEITVESLAKAGFLLLGIHRSPL